MRAQAAAPATATPASHRASCCALWFALAFSVLTLVVLLVDSFLDGMTRLDSELFTQLHARGSVRRPPAPAPRSSARPGSSRLTALLAIPLGVAAGVYLEEFADKRQWYNRLIEVNITNLAAVPAIVYGMLTAGLRPRRSTCPDGSC